MPTPLEQAFPIPKLRTFVIRDAETLSNLATTFNRLTQTDVFNLEQLDRYRFTLNEDDGSELPFFDVHPSLNGVRRIALPISYLRDESDGRV